MSLSLSGNSLDDQSARIRIVKGPGGSRFCLDRRDDVAAAFKDKRLGAATAPRHLLHALRWTGLGSVADVGASGLMVALNPPDHTRLRKVVDPVFRGVEGEAMARRIKNLADELAARIPKSGDFDLISDFAAPLPTRIVTELIGFPQTDLAKLKLWTEALAPLIDSELQNASFTRSILAFLGFRRRVMVLIKQRLHEPRGDLLSKLAHAHFVTGDLSEPEVVGTAVFVLTAGHATTTHLIGTGVLTLLQHPEQWERLRDDPTLIDSAVEEMIRFNSPIQHTGRVALEDIDFDGRHIPRNAKIRLMIARANRDPRRFDSPDAFDIARAKNRHVGFGGGIHQCIGLQLARLETRIAILTLIDRFPHLKRASHQLHWVKGKKFRGLKELPLRTQ